MNTINPDYNRVYSKEELEQLNDNGLQQLAKLKYNISHADYKETPIIPEEWDGKTIKDLIFYLQEGFDLNLKFFVNYAPGRFDVSLPYLAIEQKVALDRDKLIKEFLQKQHAEQEMRQLSKETLEKVEKEEFERLKKKYG